MKEVNVVMYNDGVWRLAVVAATTENRNKEIERVARRLDREGTMGGLDTLLDDSFDLNLTKTSMR